MALDESGCRAYSVRGDWGLNSLSVQYIKGFAPQQNSYELNPTFTAGTGKAFGFNLLIGEGRKLELRYDLQLGELTVDRRNCTNFLTDPSFTKSFATKFSFPLSMSNCKLHLHTIC